MSTHRYCPASVRVAICQLATWQFFINTRTTFKAPEGEAFCSNHCTSQTAQPQIFFDTIANAELTDGIISILTSTSSRQARQGRQQDRKDDKLCHDVSPDITPRHPPNVMIALLLLLNHHYNGQLSISEPLSTFQLYKNPIVIEQRATMSSLTNSLSLRVSNLTQASEGVSGQTVRTFVYKKEKSSGLSVWTGAFTTTSEEIHPWLTRNQHWPHLWEVEQKCQHLPEVARQPWVTRVTLTSVQVWRYASERVNDQYRPCSKRRKDSGKKTTCCVFKCPHRAPHRS